MRRRSHLNSEAPFAESCRLQAVQKPIIPVVASLIREIPGTISLGQGVVSWGPPPEAAEYITRFWADPENHKYKAVQGILPLLDAIQGKLARENQIDTARENIFVTAGGNLAFTNALLAIADPGDEIILQTPYYFNHEMAITMATCIPVLVPTDEQFQLQPNLIRNAITSKTKAIVTISPNNPTGAVYPEVHLREVNSICRERGIYHIHDEAYEYFTYGGVSHFSPGSIQGSGTFTISLFSLSKAYGFASWRLGYMTVPDQLIEAVNKVQDTILICAPVISQYAALGALAAGRKYCDERLQALSRVRDAVMTQLTSIPDLCRTPQADGAFYFLPRLQTDLDAMVVAERLVREFKVASIPGNAFGLRDGCYLRISYGALTLENAAEGVGRLARGLRSIVA
jgi:aspartate/methionine/tyrosine aminotransferase